MEIVSAFLSGSANGVLISISGDKHKRAKEIPQCPITPSPKLVEATVVNWVIKHINEGSGAFPQVSHGIFCCTVAKSNFVPRLKLRLSMVIQSKLSLKGNAQDRFRYTYPG